MSQLLIVGVDTVVGANFAATLSEHYRVFGLSAGSPLSILGCETDCYDEHDPTAAKFWVTRLKPEWIIYCSPASESVWNEPTEAAISDSLVSIGKCWATAAAQSDVPLTAISSDAIFTGPWMFHGEDSQAHCQSRNAQIIRRMEDAIRAVHARSLIVRTHAIGWSPAGSNSGWLEKLFTSLEQRTRIEVDCIRHATPIVATDLAAIVELAYQEGLTGTYHISGSERINPFQFAERFADEFDFSPPLHDGQTHLSERPTGFGIGETSLQTLKIRKKLSVAMPLLTDGLLRLHQQHLTGFTDRFRVEALSRREEIVA
ncbi:MAG: sugar nucleotide-binding protein [Planctomycetota bacterium]|nr:sugar nucleotide-binding protein [Planctomycetota bacterium]MDA1211959.1 sugar nucleotide-binding protein [Planctomycetota bacterium]